MTILQSSHWLNHNYGGVRVYFHVYNGINGGLPTERHELANQPLFWEDETDLNEKCNSSVWQQQQ